MRRMSHLCQKCGTDLARERAQKDPKYGLMLVACPACGARWPRWSPRKSSIHFYRRVDALAGLVLSASFSLLLITLTVVFTVLLADHLHDRGERLAGLWSDKSGNDLRVDHEKDDYIVYGAFFAFVLGAWTTSTLGHLRRLSLWPVLLALLALAASADLLFITAAERLAALLGQDFRAAPLSYEEVVLRHQILGLVMLVMLAGAVAGVFVRKAERFARRGIFRWRLRRQRKERLAA